MVAGGIAIMRYQGDPEPVALFDRAVQFEALPLTFWLFDDGAEAAERLAHAGLPIRFSIYYRDDEMTMFHGRNLVAFYTRGKGVESRLTPAEFEQLKRGSGSKGFPQG